MTMEHRIRIAVSPLAGKVREQAILLLRTHPEMIDAFTSRRNILYNRRHNVRPKKAKTRNRPMHLRYWDAFDATNIGMHEPVSRRSAKNYDKRVVLHEKASGASSVSAYTNRKRVAQQRKDQ